MNTTNHTKAEGCLACKIKGIIIQNLTRIKIIIYARIQKMMVITNCVKSDGWEMALFIRLKADRHRYGERAR